MTKTTQAGLMVITAVVAVIAVAFAWLVKFDGSTLSCVSGRQKSSASEGKVKPSGITPTTV